MDAETHLRDDPVTPTSQTDEAGPEIAGPPNVQEVLDRAFAGERWVLPQLESILKDHPQLWRRVYQLASAVEQRWLNLIAGTNWLLSQSVRKHIEQLKLDLAGPDPSPLEKLLAERIVLCWLGVHQAELALAGSGGASIRLARFYLQQLESANRRFLAATKMLATVRRLTGGLKIEINDGRSGAVGNATEGPLRRNDQDDAASTRSRLDQFFVTAAKDDAKLMGVKS